MNEKTVEKCIYLDNAATTFPKPDCVYEAMDFVNRNLGVNSGRGSYRLARMANEIIDDTKKRLIELANAPISSEVVFTPSITIALNQILNGIEFIKGDIVFISPFEHNAVARTLEKIKNEREIEVKLLPVKDKSLEIDIDLVNDLFLQYKPKCVCCTHISNVTGYILPVYEIFKLAKEYGAITVMDSAQSLGLVDVKMEYIDFLAFAGHKTLYGPFGIGGFIDNSNITLSKYIVGGTGSNSLNLSMPENSPGRYESSSPNIVAIAGLQAALKCLNINTNYLIEKELTKYAISRLSDIYNIKLWIPENSESHIAVISFMIKNCGMLAEDIGRVLDEDFNIAVRAGFHCAPYIHDFLNDKEYMGTVRIGIGKFTTREDIDALCEALEKLV